MSRSLPSHVGNSRPSGSLRLRLGVKRLLDILISSVLIMVFVPVFAIAAVAVLAGSGRPLLFRQNRVGRDGRRFMMIKFRTMQNDAELQLDALRADNARTGPLFKATNDPRVTTVGRVLRRLSIDELPQLFNVLGGQMSLVGPRPALPEEVDNFPVELRARESMPQGLTGLWQLEGRLDADFSRYTELDLRYIEEWSLRLDLWILLRTPFVVVRQAFNRSEVVPGELFHQEPGTSTRSIAFEREPVHEGPVDVGIVRVAALTSPLELAE